MGKQKEKAADNAELIAQLKARVQAAIDEYKKLFGNPNGDAEKAQKTNGFDQNLSVIALQKLYVELAPELAPELKPLFAALVDKIKSGKFDPKSDILNKMDEVEADIEKILDLWAQINEAFPLENRVCKEPMDVENQLKLAEWKEKIAKLRQAVEKIYALEEKIRPLIEKVGNKMSQEQAISIAENCKAILETMPADIAQQFENAKTPEQLEKALDALLNALLADKEGDTKGGKKRLNFFVVQSEDKKGKTSPIGKKGSIFELDTAWIKKQAKGMEIILAENAEDAFTKIKNILIAQNAMVGSLVIDSHGMQTTALSQGILSNSLNFTTVGGFDIAGSQLSSNASKTKMRKNDENIEGNSIFKLLNQKDEKGSPLYIDSNSSIMLSACWAGNDTEMLAQLSEEFNGASVYGQKSIGITIGLHTRRTFSAIPHWVNRKVGKMDYASPDDARNAGKWVKVQHTGEFTEEDYVDKNNPTIEEFLQTGDCVSVENLADQSLLPIIGKNGEIIESNDNFNERNQNRLEKIAKHLERKKRKKNNNNDEQSVN